MINHNRKAYNGTHKLIVCFVLFVFSISQLAWPIEHRSCHHLDDEKPHCHQTNLEQEQKTKTNYSESCLCCHHVAYFMPAYFPHSILISFVLVSFPHLMGKISSYNNFILRPPIV